MAFEYKSFLGGYKISKRGKGKFRVKGKDFSTLRNSWKHGYSDFVLCNSVKSAFKYAGKYLMKGISAEHAGSKAVKGLAMCWVFRKMLKNMPRNSSKVFSGTLGSMKANHFITRKKVARKLANPRLLKISFHSLRHWRGTMEYHRTRDLLHVQQFLGHRDIKSTMVYMHLEHAMFNTSSDEFHVKTAKTVTEACKLVEVRFDYVTTIDNNQVFRKRK